MKPPHIIFLTAVLAAFVQSNCIEAQSFGSLMKPNGLCSIYVRDAETGKIQIESPAVFEPVPYFHNGATLITGQIGYRERVAIDTSLIVRFVFPNNIGPTGFFYNNKVFVREYAGLIGVIDSGGNFILDTEYEHIAYLKDESLIAFIRIDNLSDEYYEVLKTSGRDNDTSFTVFIPNSVDAGEHFVHEDDVPFGNFISEEEIQERYSADTLAAEKCFAYGMHNMYNGDFTHAAEYFSECISVASSKPWIVAAAKYNILVCNEMTTGYHARLPDNEILEDYQINAAINGLYGPEVSDLFCGLYELPMIVHYNSHAGRKVLPYKQYVDKIYYDTDDKYPYHYAWKCLAAELLRQKKEFVTSELQGSPLNAALDTIVVSVDKDGKIDFYYNTGKEYPDESLNKSYCLDIYKFMKMLQIKYKLCNLIMTFPY